MTIKTLWQEIGNYLSDQLRCCAHCGISFGAIDLYCQECWRTLDKFRIGGKGRIQEHAFLPIFALFLWGFGAHRISQLIQDLKGGRLDHANQRLAQELLVLRIDREAEPKRPMLFVPAPPKIPGFRDHAYSLAKACAKECSGELKSLLIRNQGRDQKSGNRKARQEISFGSLDRQLGLKLKSVQVVFIDDVVTTGSTVRAAYEALGNPPNFEAWAIAFRPSLLYGALNDATLSNRPNSNLF